MTTKPLVLVSAGTYHLPFERLSAWVREWVAAHPDVRVVLQHGPSSPVAGAENVDILPYGQFAALCREADAVVLQGGAGAVMDMREIGIVPIVVPRVPGGKEVVDDHQLVFAAEMASLGVLRQALSYEEFAALLDGALAGDRGAPPEIVTPGAGRVGEIMSRPIRRLPIWLTLRRLLSVGGRLLRSRLRRSGR